MGGAEECGDLTLKPWLWWSGLSGWVCPAAICRNGPRLRKPWRSGIKVCVCVCVQLQHPLVHVWFSGSRAAVL